MKMNCRRTAQRLKGKSVAKEVCGGKGELVAGLGGNQYLGQGFLVFPIGGVGFMYFFMYVKNYFKFFWGSHVMKKLCYSV